jgi:endo-1,4-beta-xylanase
VQHDKDADGVIAGRLSRQGLPARTRPGALDRRAILAGSAAAVVAGRPTLAQGAAETLGALGQRAGLIYGASIARDIDNDAEYRALYRRETRIVTTDYALKFGYLRPDDGPPRFADADRLIAFAQDSKLLARGHTLIWNENNPDWLRRLSAAELRRVMERHIEDVMQRYAGRIHSWDVVNEPFWPDHGAPGGYRRGVWFDQLGPDYVAAAFRRAAAVDPAARLVLNEAHTEYDDSWGRGIRPALLQLIDRLQQDGVPLHAIGLQGHLDSSKRPDDKGFRAYLGEIARRGLDIYITELDVNDVAFPNAIDERDRLVAERYRSFLGAALSEPAVKMVINWQLGDAYSWLQDPEVRRKLTNGRPARPLPFDSALRRKPAWTAIASAFRQRRRAI